MYDLAVIGGGPAGAAAAITAARRGHSVLLLERGKYPRHKVCGEFVSAESLDILRTLVSDGEFFGLQWGEIGKIRRGRLFVDGSVLEAAIDPPAASISRVDLDYALWRRSMLAGVDAREEHTVLDVAHNSSFFISTGTKQFESLAVVDASGRWSNLRERGSLESTANNKKWIGLKAHFAEAAVSCSVDLYFFEGGYCGVQPLSTDHENRINACAMVRSDVARSLAEVFASHPALHARSRDWKQLTELVTTAPLIFRTPAPERAGVLLAGDAAGFVDPFVGDGISLALRSGVMAADSLHGFFEGRETLEDACDRYRRDYCRDLMPVFRASSRIRRLFSLPSAVRAPLAGFFQHTPALTRYFVQKTR
jgi:flavin-dependent dehydrogenase